MSEENKPATLGVVMNSIKIANIHNTIHPTPLFGGAKPGAIVAVRPCGEKYGDKTFLGMYLCSAPTSVIGTENNGEIILTMANHTNPAIYIEELDEIVWGSGSWWGVIKDESDLRQITDQDIENVWYVKALKQIESQKGDDHGND